jgi:hypothetical protein
MPEHPDFLNVRNLAMFLTAGPLAILLLFSAIDISWARLSQSHTPNKTNAVSETPQKIQPVKNTSDH